MAGATTDDTDDDDEQIIKPLPDRLVSDLTAHRTLALQDAFAASPSTAFAAVLHAMVLSVFYHGRTRSEAHTSELPSLMRISYAVFCLTKKNPSQYKSLYFTHTIHTSILHHYSS